MISYHSKEQQVYQQQQHRDQWSAFHGTDHAADMHHQDRQDYSMKCDHVYAPWSGNPKVNMCTKCGEWHWKQS